MIVPVLLGFHGLAFLRGGYDRGSAAGGNGVMALARFESAVGGDAVDLLIDGDLVEQFGRIANITSDGLHSPNSQGFLVDLDRNLGPTQSMAMSQAFSALIICWAGTADDTTQPTVKYTFCCAFSGKSVCPPLIIHPLPQPC